MRKSPMINECWTPQSNHKDVKITNLLVSTVTRKSGNCNLFGHAGCYAYTCNYNL